MGKDGRSYNGRADHDGTSLGRAICQWRRKMKEDDKRNLRVG
jgi:hypothetical protein